MQVSTQKKIKQVSQITFVWVLIGFYINIYNNIEFDNTTSSFLYHLPNGISFQQDMWSSILAPLIGGIIGGSLIVFWLKDRLKQYSYGRLLIIHSVIYIAIIFLVSFVILTFNNIVYDKLDLAPSLLARNIRILFTNPGIWKPISFWYIIVMLTVLFLEINDKYGEGMLWHFIIGRYHRPSEEYRVFMFLDIKSSTTIAESIGSNKYYHLINQFFKDITRPIINTRGEIYQYVGDEVIVSWKIKRPEDIKNPIQCYTEIKEILDKRNEWYIKRFDRHPSFKVGIHSGYVTVGEIGVIKKDLTYTGDVLNTASRIIGKCNELKEDLLFSEEVHNLLQQRSVVTRFISDTPLKGKSNTIKLYSI